MVFTVISPCQLKSVTVFSIPQLKDGIPTYALCGNTWYVDLAFVGSRGGTWQMVPVLNQNEALLC
jgi:hypothetical protein